MADELSQVHPGQSPGFRANGLRPMETRSQGQGSHQGKEQQSGHQSWDLPYVAVACRGYDYNSQSCWDHLPKALMRLGLLQAFGKMKESSPGPAPPQGYVRGVSNC